MNKNGNGAHAPRQMLFPSFFLGGFECATHIDRSRRRQDYVVLTDHERQYREDYERAYSVGIRAIREGLRWHLVDRGGRYDFSSIAPMVDAAEEMGITLINCLFHYGWPDELDPLGRSFVSRFRDYAVAFAEWRVGRVSAPRWYGVINEPSMLAFAAGDDAWFEPFLEDNGIKFKKNLVRAGIAGTDAIRMVDPDARFIVIDPVAHTVPPKDDPDKQEEVDEANAGQFAFWDMMSGKAESELGGAPGYLDVVGVNCYPDTQHELGSTEPLPLDDPRRQPFRELLWNVWERYRRPILVAETSARGLQRSHWILDMTRECLAAMEMGVDLQGICLYPLVDMPEWKHGEVGPLGKLGLWDVVKQGEGWERVVNEGYLTALRKSQRLVEKHELTGGNGHKAPRTAPQKVPAKSA